jgi:catalase (peroxidase I)
MGWKQALDMLALNARRNKDKLLQAIPENLTTRSNTVKTADLRIDVHQSSTDPNKAVAKIQANSQAKDQAVKDFIKSGNKVIPFDRSNFDMDDFEHKIRKSRS